MSKHLPPRQASSRRDLETKSSLQHKTYRKHGRSVDKVSGRASRSVGDQRLKHPGTKGRHRTIYGSRAQEEKGGGGWWFETAPSTRISHPSNGQTENSETRATAPGTSWGFLPPPAGQGRGCGSWTAAEKTTQFLDSDSPPRTPDGSRSLLFQTRKRYSSRWRVTIVLEKAAEGSSWARKRARCPTMSSARTSKSG